MVAEVESGEAAVEAAAELRPGLILMDINLPGITGIEATRQIVEADGTTVVLMSTYTEQDLPADARTCGAVAYVHKEDLGPAVIAAYGRAWLVGGQGIRGDHSDDACARTGLAADGESPASCADAVSHVDEAVALRPQSRDRSRRRRRPPRR